MQENKSKPLLRKKIKSILSQIPETERDKKSLKIMHTLIEVSSWKQASEIYIYLSFESEVQTDELVLKALSYQKIVAIPRIVGKEMFFYQIKTLVRDLEKNKFGIREPAQFLPVIQPSGKRLSLVVVPGIAFDKNKNRIGRGGGYYDRFIAGVKQKRIDNCIFAGVCFSEQIVSAVPVGSHDQKVDLIITDKELIG